MAFDKPTRNRLASFVGKARDLIADEFTQQFQSLYGISDKGTITPLDQLGHLDDTGLGAAALLRERVDYLVKTHPDDREGTKAAVARLAREQAFTVLNRLAAIRMAEKRGLIVESVGKGYQSKGFKVFEQVAGSGLGDTYHRYCRYLFCLFDELAVDLGVLFDRRSPHGLLFPRETALLALFDLLNAADLDPLWAEDETIGWVYQYYNDPAERKKMRDESAAPRNSRELAVRNQFFTPRYVVEFLTDNTLGRIWYEMTKGQTRLAEQCRYLIRRPTEIFQKPGETIPVVSEQEGLSQEELLKQPAYIPHRPLKDPRELRMLDPACGSMHFGLYAFDLYEVIYEEAWDMGMESLRRDFPDKETFLREMPRLVIENNIHGIDIDPRAAQIAGLSLWLRAQKSWQAQRVPAAQRPRILRSNIVCAEPMPGEKELLREFTAQLEVPALGFLIEQVFDKMQLAGDAGSLLKIEEETRDIIYEAKRRWKERPRLQQMGLFHKAPTKPEQAELPLDFSGVTDERFWEGAEENVYQALREYSELAGEHGYQRRLFAEDAERGFAFIDVCRRRFDVVLMNPPFGEPSQKAKAWIASAYPITKNDILGPFLERGIMVLNTLGSVGAITARTAFQLSSMEGFRKELILKETNVGVFADLGGEVLDSAMVKTAAYALHKGRENTLGAYIDLTSAEDKGGELTATIAGGLSVENVFWVNQTEFRHIPGAPFAYWADAAIRHCFAQLPSFSSLAAEVKQGLGTTDDFRFVRAAWEVSPVLIGPGKSWALYAKGGESNDFYSDIHLVVNWADGGREVYEFNNIPFGGAGAPIRNPAYYFRPGLTYTSYTNKGFSPRVLPSGCIFTTAGMGIFVPDPLPTLSLLNSRVIQLFLLTITDERKWEVGYVSNIPIKVGSQEATARFSELALRAWREAVSASLWDETQRLFSGFVITGRVDSLVQEENQLKRAAQSHGDILRGIRREIDEYTLVLYGLTERHLEFVETRLGLGGDENPEAGNLTTALLSFFIGSAFGRWDIRFATTEKPVAELPDPFAPLPVCPPGMLQNVKGLPASPMDVPTDYPLRISWPGILVDDENHPEDIIARVEDALRVIWNDRWEAIEHEACELLGVKTLRDYFRRPAGFFADHLKRYSKSRRQAPIYWPLSTAKGSYTLWIYYHRLTDQTLHTALADFVDPKLKSVRAEISALRESGTHRDRLEELLDLEKELADFHTEIERIIKLPWKPNLNDGVLITASPMWKLFRLPKWQKDLKACWEKLEKGDYDWAHLAYSIWPKRVEEVCKKDRSIAIAHGLEHLCRVEPPKPKVTRGRKKALQADLDEMEG